MKKLIRGGGLVLIAILASISLTGCNANFNGIGSLLQGFGSISSSFGQLMGSVSNASSTPSIGTSTSASTPLSSSSAGSASIAGADDDPSGGRASTGQKIDPDYVKVKQAYATLSSTVNSIATKNYQNDIGLKATQVGNDLSAAFSAYSKNHNRSAWEKAANLARSFISSNLK